MEHSLHRIDGDTLACIYCGESESALYDRGASITGFDPLYDNPGPLGYPAPGFGHGD